MFLKNRQVMEDDGERERERGNKTGQTIGTSRLARDRL